MLGEWYSLMTGAVEVPRARVVLPVWVVEIVKQLVRKTGPAQQCVENDNPCRSLVRKGVTLRSNV